VCLLFLSYCTNSSVWPPPRKIPRSPCERPGVEPPTSHTASGCTLAGKILPVLTSRSGLTPPPLPQFTVRHGRQRYLIWLAVGDGKPQQLLGLSSGRRPPRPLAQQGQLRRHLPRWAEPLPHQPQAAAPRLQDIPLQEDEEWMFRNDGYGVDMLVGMKILLEWGGVRSTILASFLST